MRATRQIGLVIVVVLATVMLVGAAAASAKVSAPNNVVLYGAEGAGGAQDFLLSNADGKEMVIGVVSEQLADGEGNRVGRHHWQCMHSDFVWYCTGVIRLRDTASTDGGTITLAGLFNGFNGESLAITGGTGAYAGAEGTVLLTVKNGKFARTVKFIQ